MAASINQVGTAATEIVLTERKVTTEWRVRQITENIENRFVRVEVELGPFVEEDGPGGQKRTRGSGGRSLVIWDNDAYDAVRDTWTNADLLAIIPTKLV